MTANNNMTL
jgi:hypothetical protein